jgi:aldose sugar dehydrogenase
MRTFLIIAAFFTFCACNKNKVTDSVPDDWPTDSIRTVKANLNFPWEILWGKDDHIWMTERGGKISKINPKTGDVVFAQQITDVVANGEGGLLGMAQHPDFLTNGNIFVVYNYSNAGAYTEKVVLMQFASNALSVVKNIITNIPAAGIHNGSRLCVVGDKLFITTGDAAVPNNAQSAVSLSGKVLRYNLDGSVPSDNPIPNSPIWSLGHRNPQGLVLYKNMLYASEHGASIEDEVNVIESAKNYGWPNVQGPCDNVSEIPFCGRTNKEPIWSSGNSTIAVCGLDVYTGTKIPDWQNSLLMTTLKDASLRILKLSADGLSVTSQQTIFKNKFGRLRDVCVSPAGRVYICTSNGNNTDSLVEISK